MVLTEVVLLASMFSAGVVEKNLMCDFELTNFDWPVAEMVANKATTTVNKTNCLLFYLLMNY